MFRRLGHCRGRWRWHMSALCQLHPPQQWPNLRNTGPIYGILRYYTVKDSDLNFFWAPKLSAGGLNFGLDSQYGNWNISSLNSPLRGILYSMVWRCNLRVVKVNIAFSCRSFMVRRLMFRFGLKFITANLLFMFNRMIVCVCQEHKP